MCSSTVAGLTIQLAPIDRHLTARNSRTHQRPSLSRGGGHSARGFGPAPPTDERYEKNRLSFGQLISRHRRACTPNQPIRLFNNEGNRRLFSSEEAEHHEHRAT